MTDKNSSFFIIGCQRSGTTLIRLILESHSKINCIDEPNCYRELIDFSEENTEIFTGFKTPLFTEQFEEPFFTDSSLDFIVPNKFKKYPRVFLIRDVRDTIASMQNLKQDNSTWYNIWPEKSLEFWRYTIPNFDSIYKEDIKKINDSSDKLLSLASFYWKYKNLSYFSYEQSNANICKIKYEELVSNPKKTIEKITNFLSVDWEDNLLLHHKQNHTLTDSDGLTVGDTNTKIPIQNYIDKYKNYFSESQIDEIMSISGDLMKKFDY